MKFNKIKNGVFLLWAGLAYLSGFAWAFLGLEFLNYNQFIASTLCLLGVILTKIYALQILKLPKIIKENYIKNA